MKLGDSAVRESVQQELQALLKSVNAELEAHEELAFAAVVRDPWTMENGLLTPTLKIKRSAIEQRAAPRVEDWMKTRSEIVWE